MKTLRIVAANLLLFGEHIPKLETLAQYDIKEVFRVIIRMLDREHLHYFASAYIDLLPRYYPEIEAHRWMCLSAYLKQEWYEDIFRFSMEIILTTDEDLPYHPISYAWQAMNHVRSDKGVVNTPNREAPMERVIRSKKLNMITVNGNQEPTEEDVAKKGAMDLLWDIFYSTQDGDGLKDFFGQVNAFLFIALEEAEFFSPKYEEHEMEEKMSMCFNAFMFHDGLILLAGLIAANPGYQHALDTAVYSAINSYNHNKEVEKHT